MGSQSGEMYAVNYIVLIRVRTSSVWRESWTKHLFEVITQIMYVHFLGTRMSDSCAQLI